jgi:hypothetical protein
MRVNACVANGVRLSAGRRVAKWSTWMSHPRVVIALWAVLFCAAIVASGPVPRTVHAQDLKSPDDPFGDVDLDSLKKGGSTGNAPATDEPAPKAVEKIFDNNNPDAVQNQPTRATEMTLNGSLRIARITTYHWNNGQGAPPGTIALRSSTGEVFGPWQASGEPGQGGVPNAYWVVEPDVILPAGIYSVIDSDPATWAQNGATGGAGIAIAERAIE